MIPDLWDAVRSAFREVTDMAEVRRAAVKPLAAGWHAGEDVHASYYGPPLRLAKDARRFESVDWPDAADRFAAAGVRAATRAGSLRAAFHTYTTESDVDTAVAALTRPR